MSLDKGSSGLSFQSVNVGAAYVIKILILAAVVNQDSWVDLVLVTKIKEALGTASVGNSYFNRKKFDQVLEQLKR